MTNEEIIKLGTTLGLKFDEKTNYKDMLARNIVVFDGINGQRFLIEGKWSKEVILEEMGKSLILMGERKKKLEIHRVLNITGD
jgi:hypothetical protein